MIKTKKYLGVLMLLLIFGCSSNKAFSNEPKRFYKWSSNGIDAITDLNTGCQYVRSAGYTSYTYLHGTYE